MQRIRENGIDGLNGLVALVGGWLICLTAWWVTQQVVWLVVSVGYLMMGGLFLHTSLIGQERIWARLLPQLTLAAGTRVLDVGCGRGRVLGLLAEALPYGGHVTGIEGKRPHDEAATVIQQRLVTNGWQERATVITADLRELPLADAQFDLVVSSLAVHRVRTKTGRLESLQELNRVLVPDGQLVIVDWGFSCQEYHEALRHLGYRHIQITGNGPDGWWSGPWMPTLTLRATKPTP